MPKSHEPHPEHAKSSSPPAASETPGTTGPDACHTLWSDRLDTEVLFWKRWFDSGGLDWPEDFRARVDPNTPLQPELAAMISSSEAKIIDVGAGPLTVVGRMWNGHRLQVTAVDPLADEYSRLISAYNLVPPVKTQRAEAEALADLFEKDTFDLAYARNCLDHSYNPVLAIRQMLHITKPQGTVYLQHLVNEGERERYLGLHQWNFAEQGGEFVISAPDKQPVNVSRDLANLADISVQYSDCWLIVSMKKRQLKRRRVSKTR